MLPDLERAERIGEFWSYPQSRTFAKLLIGCEEDQPLRAVLVGLQGEGQRGQWRDDLWRASGRKEKAKRLASTVLGPYDVVVDEYEAGRPGYPDALFNALEPIAGVRVLEGGAGTGLATRTLLERGARIVAFDIGIGVLSRAMRSMPGLAGIIADGAAMPFPDECADLLCFAQSWHWLEERRRATEAARVLRRGGRWAAWWSHARADQEPWFESYWDAMESATVARRRHRDTDWGREMRDSGLFDVLERITCRWIRETTVDQWLAHNRSHSYVTSLPEPDRLALLAQIERTIRHHFPDGHMRVPYETWLWVATKR